MNTMDILIAIFMIERLTIIIGINFEKAKNVYYSCFFGITLNIPFSKNGRIKNALLR